jgi:hypothetical protein
LGISLKKPVFHERTPCNDNDVGSICSWNGWSINFWISILTNRFNLIKATRFERYHPNFEWAFNAFRMRIVINAVHISIITAFSLVPINDFMWSSCLIPLKNISTCHLPLYNSLIVLGYHVCWFMINSITCLFSSSRTDILLNRFEYLFLKVQLESDDTKVWVRWMLSNYRV